MIDKDEVIHTLQETIQGLQQEVGELKIVIAELQEKIAGYEKRLGIDSQTSSKPPSSDGPAFKKPLRTLSSRSSNKPFGGQKDHTGKTLEQVKDPTSIIIHSVARCEHCGCDLSEVKTERTIKRQVFDIEIKQVVIEHQAEVKRCTCGCCTTARFPVEVKAPVQIGDTLRAYALYLSNHFIAKDRLSEIIEDLFQVPISDTSILSYESQLANHLNPFYQDVLNRLKTADVKHQDETGLRVAGKREWMHVLSSDTLTYLWPVPKRTSLVEGLEGICVHDHYKPYRRQQNVAHAFCNAHHLRELNALIVYEKEPWAQEMHTLLLSMYRASQRENLSPERIVSLQRVYDKVIQHGFDYHESLPPLESKKKGAIKRRTGHNLLIRLRDYKTAVLRFLSDRRVPFTNNQAERDFRMVKVQQKVSGCFRTADGAKNFAIIRSLTSTVRKQGLNVIDAFKKALHTEVRFADIVPEYTRGPPAVIR